MLLTPAFVMAAIAVFAYAIPLPGSTHPGHTHENSQPRFTPSNIAQRLSTHLPMTVTRPHETTTSHRTLPLAAQHQEPTMNPRVDHGRTGDARVDHGRTGDARVDHGRTGDPRVDHGRTGDHRGDHGRTGDRRVDDRRNDPYERYLHRRPTIRPVIVPVIINGGVTRESIDVAFESPVVVNTGGFIDYSRMTVFSQQPTFQYSSCQSISRDLQFFIGGFYQIVATIQATSWDADRVTSVFGEFCFNLDLLSQRLAIYDYSSDGYPTCREEFVDAVVRFLKQLQGFLSLIPQRYGGYQIFDGIMSQCYSALQRFFGVMQLMNVNTDQVYSQIDANIFAQARLPIQPFRNADSGSLLRGALNYSGN